MNTSNFASSQPPSRIFDTVAEVDVPIDRNEYQQLMRLSRRVARYAYYCKKLKDMYAYSLHKLKLSSFSASTDLAANARKTDLETSCFTQLPQYT
jgi:hypothetical protein